MFSNSWSHRYDFFKQASTMLPLMPRGITWSICLKFTTPFLPLGGCYLSNPSEYGLELQMHVYQSLELTMALGWLKYLPLYNVRCSSSLVLWPVDEQLYLSIALFVVVHSPVLVHNVQLHQVVFVFLKCLNWNPIDVEESLVLSLGVSYLVSLHASFCLKSTKWCRGSL